MTKRKDVGAERAGRRAKEQSRREQLEFLRRRWPLLLVIAVVTLAGCAVPFAIWPTAPVGVAVGLVLASAGWGLALVTMQFTGTAASLMGGEAELDTAERLRALRSSGWVILDSIPLEEGRLDLDHLAISPAGVFAIETKWSASDWFARRQRSMLMSACRQASDRAQLFARRRSFYALKGEEVQPVLVVWGRDRDEALPQPQDIEGVTVVPGPRLLEWARSQPDVGLDETRIRDAASKVGDYLKTTNSHVLSLDPRGRFVRDGLGGVVSDLLWGASGALSGVLVVGFAAAWIAGTSLLTFAGAASSLAGISFLVWWKAWRTAFALGWTVGAVASIPLVASWYLAAAMA